MKATKCPAKEKKRGKKREKIGEERKRKVKVKCRSGDEIEVNILHLDQKAAKCTPVTRKPLD